MKVMTILGTRPEIIRLSLLIRKLDGAVEHFLVHTGQNHDPTLSDRFFTELEVRGPDAYLGVDTTSPARQIGQILERTETLLREQRPDRVLLLGDTNSALAAICAKRLGIPVFHMEAGNRCFDDRVPEEVNRRIIDHCSDVLMPYTSRSRENLLREGFPGQRIYVTGNPIGEVIGTFEHQIEHSSIMGELGLEELGYFLVTMHRAENVDEPSRLRIFLDAFSALAADHDMPVIVSTHPRTRERLKALSSFPASPEVRFAKPFGFFDFARLERAAFCVLSDSGTVQEECALFGVANVTIRDCTERPETLECGSNYLSGADLERIVRGVSIVTARRGTWTPPPEYLTENVSDIVLRLVTGHHLHLEA